MKTVDFSETIAASDLTGCRNRHLIHGVQRRMISVDNMSKINLLRTKMADF